MIKIFANHSIKVVSVAVVLFSTILSFQNCSEFKSLDANASSTNEAMASETSLMSFGGNVGAKCISAPGEGVFANPGIASTDDVIGVVSLAFDMTDGSGSGSCNYEIGIAEWANPGTKFAVVGSCKDSAGNNYTSKGTLTPVFGSRWPATNFDLVAGFNVCRQNASEITMNALVNLSTSQISNIRLREVIMAPSSATEVIIAKGKSGSYSGKNPYGTYPGWSTVQSVTLPEGSVCSLTANPWGRSREVIAATCSSVGGSFSLSGMGTLGSVSLGANYEIEGVAQDGKTYDHFYRMADGSWVGTWLNKAPVGYNLSYFNNKGEALGACSLGSPNSIGDISGTCLLKNIQFGISGNVGAKDPISGLYAADLGGTVNGVTFSAQISYDPLNRTGSGNWSASDGASGKASVSAAN